MTPRKRKLSLYTKIVDHSRPGHIMTEELETSDDATVGALCGRIAALLSGERLSDSVAALSALSSYMICALSDTKTDALALQQQMHERSTEMLALHYDAYHAEYLRTSGDA